MNADQKKRIAHEISNWKNACNCRAVQLAGDRMAALLQELVDAPEVLPATNPSQISSSAEPFGYFKAEPFGWTDCAETDDGAIALYTAPPVSDVEPVAYLTGVNGGYRQSLRLMRRIVYGMEPRCPLNRQRRAWRMLTRCPHFWLSSKFHIYDRGRWLPPSSARFWKDDPMMPSADWRTQNDGLRCR